MRPRAMPVKPTVNNGENVWSGRYDVLHYKKRSVTFLIIFLCICAHVFGEHPRARRIRLSVSPVTDHDKEFEAFVIIFTLGEAVFWSFFINFCQQ